MKTKEEKSLLHNDLCARLPHKVKCIVDGLDDCTLMPSDIEEEREIKPYLRPMSSMTEEERKEVNNLIKDNRPNPYGKINNKGMDNLFSSVAVTSSILIDWLNAHHFDFRNLIEKGLAIAVDENNNPYKE
ncbi:MAG: hypothetical protein J6Y78_16440 [Paludibacteraceae bacterium]|nr:hypothetical protein [Paludibacteraceae bacterium]